MSIRREIEVTRKALPRPIDVTYGTNILSIEFDLVDFNLPVAVIAEASCKGVSGKSRTQDCSVSENVISFTPKIGFFEEGKNILQLRITTSEGSLFTFAQTVNCHYTIDFDGAQELENDPTFVEIVLQMREDIDELKENGIPSEDSSIVVDSELSLESENPVQNKVVTKKINELSEQITNLQGLLVDGNEVAY